MAEICPVCGLPLDLCVCEEIRKEQQRIQIRLETRKWRKEVTIVDGIDDKDTDLGRLAQIPHVQFGDDVRGDLAGWGAQTLAQRHGAVGLIIAEPRILSGPDHFQQAARVVNKLIQDRAKPVAQFQQ